MRIQDSNGVLKQYLRKEYEGQMKKLLDEATAARDDRVTKRVEEARAEAKDISLTAERQADQERQTALGSAELNAEQALSQTKEHLLQEIFASVKTEVEKLTAAKKKKMLQSMHESVLASIKEQGFKQSDFTLHTWKGAKMKGVKSDLDFLGVRAESKSITIEDSVTDQLEALRGEIYTLVLKELGI